MVERTASPRSPLQTQKPTLDATLLIDGRGAPRSGSPGRSTLNRITKDRTGASAARSAPATLSLRVLLRGRLRLVAGQLQFLLRLFILRIGGRPFFQERQRLVVFAFLEIGIGQADRAGVHSGDFLDHLFPDLDRAVGVALGGEH